MTMPTPPPSTQKSPNLAAHDHAGGVTEVSAEEIGLGGAIGRNGFAPQETPAGRQHQQNRDGAFGRTVAAEGRGDLSA